MPLLQPDLSPVVCHFRSSTQDSSAQQATREPAKERKKFDDQEELALVAGIKKFGLGHWKEIQMARSFPGCTNMNLSDKYRNLQRNASLGSLEDRVELLLAAEVDPLEGLRCRHHPPTEAQGVAHQSRPPVQSCQQRNPFARLEDEATVEE